MPIWNPLSALWKQSHSACNKYSQVFVIHHLSSYKIGMTKPTTSQPSSSAVLYSRNTWIKGLYRPYASSAPSSYKNILNLISGPYCLFPPAYKSWKLPVQVKCGAALNLYCTAFRRRGNASKVQDMVEMEELLSLRGVSPFYHHTSWIN